MATAITETKQVGGSLMVAIPKGVRKAMSLEKNQMVEIEIKKLKPSFFGKFKNAPKFTAEDELKGD